MVAAGRRAGIAFHRVVALLAAFAVASSDGGDVTMSLDDAMARAVALQNAHAGGEAPGAAQEAETLYRAVLRAAPAHAHALHNLGALKHAVGNNSAAEGLLLAAVRAADTEAGEQEQNRANNERT